MAAHQVRTLIHMLSQCISLAIYLTAVLSTDAQNRHHYNDFHLPTSTAQSEVIDMSHYNQSCNRQFLLICGWVGCCGQLVVSCQQGP
jgi:hypothetical protein